MSRLFFDPQSYEKFKDLLSQVRYYDGQELEVRFGTFKSDQRDASPIFFPGVSGKDYFRFLNTLQSSNEFRFVSTERTRVKYYSNNHRLIEKLELNFDSVISTRLEEKRKLKTVDLRSLWPYSVRFALSSEKPKSLDILSSLTYQSSKLQTRHIFESKNKNYQIHLSAIKRDNELSYEVELEGNGNFFLREENYIPVLKNTFKMMTDKFSACSQKFQYLFLKSQGPYVNSLREQSENKLRYEKENYTIDNKPVSVYYNNAHSLNKGFVVSNKLDGVYYNLVISKAGVALVNTSEIQLLTNDDMTEQLYKEANLNNNTIVVGELYKNEFFVFDVISVDGEEVYKKNYTERLSHRLLPTIYKVFTKITSIPVKNKLVKFSENVIDDINAIIKESPKYYNQKVPFEEFNDGIIFTKQDAPYYEESFKWKFPERISIDGKVTLVSETNDKKVFDVYFKRFKDSLDKLPSEEQLVIKKTDEFFGLVKNDMIVELGWKNGEFVVERIRDDKILPNALRTAENTLTQMKNPMSLEELLKVIVNGPSLEQEFAIDDSKVRNERFRRFCNLIKIYLINTNCKSTSNVLDLGAGVGGDLFKYQKVDPAKLFLVEPFLYEGLLERIGELKNNDFRSKIQTINTAAQNKDIIESVIGDSKINVINMMFSMTFFGEDNMINKLCNTLGLLERDGSFVTAYMDGEKTLEKLRLHHGLYKGSFFEMQDLNSVLSNNPAYRLKLGHKINIALKGESITLKGQEEYLLPPVIIKNKFSQAGLTLNSSLSFDKLTALENPPQEIRDALKLYNDMSEEEKELISLFRFDVYKKQEYKKQQMELVQRMNALTSLSPKKRELIKFAFQKDGEKFYRTGVIGDGSCFFYAALQSVAYKEFYMMIDSLNRQLVSFIRNSISDSLTISEYTRLQKGELAVLHIDEHIAKILEKRPEDYKKFIEARKVVERNDKYFENYFRAIKKLNLTDINMKTLTEKCYLHYKNELAKAWIRAEHLEYISEQFQINFFIVTDLSLDVYLGVEKYNPEYDSIIILNLAGKYGGSSPHYESVVRTYDGKSSSIFNNDDEIIQRLLARIASPTVEIQQEEQVPQISEEIKEEEEKKISEEIKEKQNLQDIKNNIEEIVRKNFMIKDINLVFETVEYKKKDLVMTSSKKKDDSLTSINDQEYENMRDIYIDGIIIERKLSRDYLIDETGETQYNDIPSDIRRQSYRNISLQIFEDDGSTVDNKVAEMKERIVSDFSNKNTLKYDKSGILNKIIYDERDIDTLENFINLLSDFFDNNVTQDTELMKSLYEKVKRTTTKNTKKDEKITENSTEDQKDNKDLKEYLLGFEKNEKITPVSTHPESWWNTLKPSGDLKSIFRWKLYKVFGFRDFEYENFGKAIPGYLDKFIQINDDNCYLLFFEFAKACYVGNVKSLEEIVKPSFFEKFLDATLESYATNIQVRLGFTYPVILAIVWFNYYKEGNYQEINTLCEKIIDTFFKERYVQYNEVDKLQKIIDIGKYYSQIQDNKVKYDAVDYAEKRSSFFYSIFNKYRTCKENPKKSPIQREKNIREIMKKHDLTYDEVVFLDVTDSAYNYLEAKNYADSAFKLEKQKYREYYKKIKEKYKLSDSEMKNFNYFSLTNYDIMPELVERIIANKIRK